MHTYENCSDKLAMQSRFSIDTTIQSRRWIDTNSRLNRCKHAPVSKRYSIASLLTRCHTSQCVWALIHLIQELINVAQKISESFGAWPWLAEACSPEGAKAAIFLDVQTEAGGRSLANTDEACMVLALVNTLLKVYLTASILIRQGPTRPIFFIVFAF